MIGASFHSFTKAIIQMLGNAHEDYAICLEYIT
jgi:hypothetical protein